MSYLYHHNTPPWPALLCSAQGCILLRPAPWPDPDQWNTSRCWRTLAWSESGTWWSGLPPSWPCSWLLHQTEHWTEWRSEPLYHWNTVNNHKSPQYFNYNLHKISVELLLRHSDCSIQSSSHQRILLSLPLPVLPPLLISAAEEVGPDIWLGEDGVATHSVDETLKLVHPMLYELLFITSWNQIIDQYNSFKSYLNLDFNSRPSRCTIYSKCFVFTLEEYNTLV